MTHTTKLVIFGAMGHARVIADAARSSGKFNVLGFIEQDDAQDVDVGVPILARQSELPAVIAAHPGVQGIVGIGDNRIRLKLTRMLCDQHRDFAFATVVHPTAVIASGVRVGVGSFIAASATLNCGVNVGSHAVINTSASVDHDCTVGDFGFVGPGAALAGSVTLGSNVFVGTGAVIIPNIQVGDDALIGAGSVVIRQVLPGSRVAGNPAKIINPGRTRGAG